MCGSREGELKKMEFLFSNLKFYALKSFTNKLICFAESEQNKKLLFDCFELKRMKALANNEKRFSGFFFANSASQNVDP